MRLPPDRGCFGREQHKSPEAASEDAGAVFVRIAGGSEVPQMHDRVRHSAGAAPQSMDKRPDVCAVLRSNGERVVPTLKEAFAGRDGRYLLAGAPRCFDERICKSGGAGQEEPTTGSREVARRKSLGGRTGFPSWQPVGAKRMRRG